MNYKLLALIILTVLYFYEMVLNVISMRSVRNHPIPENVSDGFNPILRAFDRFIIIFSHQQGKIPVVGKNRKDGRIRIHCLNVFHGWLGESLSSLNGIFRLCRVFPWKHRARG